MRLGTGSKGAQTPITKNIRTKNARQTLVSSRAVLLQRQLRHQEGLVVQERVCGGANGDRVS